jgi:hypothetical protein
LKKLDCTKNNISVLDVSSLTNLEELSCGWNPNISSLDVSSLTNLKSLSCWRLGISSLDVSSLRNLEALYCDENSKITSLDVSGLTKLRDLFCRDNNISSLDLTGLANLQDLRCENNNMSTLKLSAMPGLWYFSCFNNNISTLDVSGLTNLSSLHCQNNNISTLDVSGLTNLSSLHCQNNKLSALYLPSVTLMSIYCYGNRLTSLDLSAIPQITFRNTSAQTPTINKIGNGTSYTNNVFMDPATVFDSSAITYSNGMLISTDKTVASTTFTSPTGYSGIDLSGTITFVYKETLDGRVAITGTAKSGETLKADTSGLKTTPVSDLGDISYQWYRGGVAIPSASAQTYKVVDADVGKAITVTVSTANCVGSVTSLAVTPIAADNNNIKPGGGGTGGGAGSGGAGSDVTGGSTSGGGAGTGSGMGDGNSSGSGGSGSNASSDNTSPTNPQAIPAAGDPIDNNSRQTIWLLSAAGFTCLVAAARIRRREQH